MKEESVLKKQLSIACSEYVEARIARFNATMKELEEALSPESRSCMGDKYETSRAMLHLEFEKISGQVEQFKALQKTVSLITINPGIDSTSFGSVVMTNGANYFISVPAGEIQQGEDKFYAVGINSPVAQALLGKKEGDQFSINGKAFKIEKIIN